MVRNMFFYKQKTAYELRISDWSSDVCSSDLLGRFVVHRGGEDMTPPAGMAANVVKILAVRGAGVHLDELAEVLWPDSDPGRGRTRLRNVLARIRRASGDIVQRRGESVTLADGVEVDSRRFDRAADAALRSEEPT